jgi:hypothetical protein
MPAKIGAAPNLGIADGETLAQADALAQVDCIVRSETFRTSGVLRRLLKFLADKHFSGDAEHLKEYTVAVEALGRASTYDPRHDSAVRIQAGRLRQKLAEYYRTEGQSDDIVIDLPKGHFKLTFDLRQTAGTIVPRRSIRGWGQILIYVALAASAAWGIYAAVLLRHERQYDTSSDVTWTPALKQLWGPVLTTNRPLILIIEDPLFFRLQSNDLSMWFRDSSINDWTQVGTSPKIQSLIKGLKPSRVDPGHFYTPIAEVTSTLLLGKLLGTHQQNISLARSSQVSWQELGDHNVVYVGSRPFFDVHSRGTWLEPQLIQVNDGIQNLKPGIGEPEKFVDQYGPPGTENGEFHVLVTHIPGPTDTSDIISFTSNRSPGFVGAVQWFTNADLAQKLVEKIKKTPTGKLPLYYQVLLKVKFEGGVSTQTSYVLYRELNRPGKSTVAER